MARGAISARGSDALANRAARHPWWVSFTLFFALAGLWSVASPLFSVPDEPAHAVRAVGVVRGQLRARQVTGPDGSHGVVRVPLIYDRAHLVPACYAFRPKVTAECAPAFVGSRRDGDVLTDAGRYPPLYYSLVGAPGALLPSALGVRLMRLVSTALCAALLASAVAILRKLDNGGPLLLGLAVAVTPMVLYLNGSVNPSGFETSAAIALWAALLALSRGADPSPRLVAQAATFASVLVLSRPLSPLWGVLITLLVAMATTRGRLGALSRSSAVRRGVAVVLVAVVLAGFWILWAQALGGYTPGGRPAPTATTTQILRMSLGKVGNQLRQMIGIFGWLDALAPLATYWLWSLCLGLLVLGRLALTSTKGNGALVTAIGLTILLPVALESSQARSFGLIWQGRYTLPLAAGVPFLAALGADRLLALLRRAPRLVMAALGVANLLAFVWALRRYTVGVNGWFDRLRWQPPIPALLLVVAFAVTLSIYGWWMAALANDALAGPATVDSPGGDEPSG